MKNKPREERKQEQPKSEVKLKLDPELQNPKKQGETKVKPKPEKTEVRGIGTFFKPKPKTDTENTPSKTKEEFKNPMLNGLKVYQTEARKQQSSVAMNWTNRDELINEMKRFVAYKPERSYCFKNVVMFGSKLEHINAKFPVHNWVNPRAPLKRSDNI